MLLHALKQMVKLRWPALFLKMHFGKYVLKSLWRRDPSFHRNFRTYKVKALQPASGPRPRVLHVVANFHTGGSARLVVDLLEHLGHQYEQAVLTRDIPGRAAYKGFSLMVVSKEEANTGRMLAYLRRYQPQLLHIHYLGHQNDLWGREDYQWYLPMFRAAAKWGCPVVENINIPTPPYLHDSVSRYVYVSRYVQEQFGRVAPNHLVVYPGSDLRLFSPGPAEKNSPPCIGMVYRLDGDKINEKAIQVFIEVVKQRPQTKVMIVGGGNLLAHFQHSVAHAGLSDNFQFTGYVAYDDLPACYQKLDVFVAPVHNESFGQVTPFAMSTGIAVAGYDVGALSEILGSRNYLAPAGDVAALAALVVHLIDHPVERRSIGELNRQRAKLFSVEQMVAGYAALYHQLVPQTAKIQRK